MTKINHSTLAKIVFHLSLTCFDITINCTGATD